MKISSASKKVLASALSAAMVVAFAPTVAFGATSVKVTVDAAGGNASTSTYTVETGSSFVAPSVSKAGYTLDHWYVDYDADGEEGNGEAVANAEAVSIDESKLGTATEVTLRAVWKAPALGEASVTDYTDDKSPAKISVGLSKFDKGYASLKKDTTYTITVKNPDGVTVGTKVYEPAAAGETDAGYAYTSDTSIDVTFTKVTDSTNRLNADLDYMVGGAYTVEVSDGTDVVAKKTVKVVRLTTVANDAAKTEKQYHFAEGDDVAVGGSYVDANGYSASSTTGLKAGEVKWTQVSGTVTVTASDSCEDMYAQYRALGWDVSGLDDNTASYTASVVDPSGAEVWSQKVTGDGDGDDYVCFTFDQTAAGNRAYNSATEKAGDYVLTVTATPKDGSAASSAKAKVTLTEVKLSAGEHGAFKSSVKASDTDFFQVGLAFNVDGIGMIDAAEGYEFKEWQLNGKAYNASSNKIKEGEVNEVTAAYKDATQVAAPTVVSATHDAAKKTWTVKLATATAGAGIKVKVGSGAYSDYIDADGFTFSDTATGVMVKGVTVTGSTASTVTKDSDEVALAWDQSVFTRAVKGGSSDLEKYIGVSKVKWAAAEKTAAAVTAGQAALDAQGVDSSSRWGKLVTAQVKAVYEAVAADAEAQLAVFAGEKPVVVNGKAYVVDAISYAAAEKAIAAAKAKVAGKETAKTVVDSDYVTGVSELIEAVNTTAKYAESADYTAADVKAASDVTAALQAATDATSAKAAIEAYNALTDAQKKLVATADVTAAQKIVADQEKIDDQDQAAVNYCNSLKKKTVKVAKKTKKTAKKASVSWKKQVSESGNAVTYAKVSGSAKITVSSNGVATLKKGVKKGTYKVKIAASCGNATRNLVTAKFIVK